MINELNYVTEDTARNKIDDKYRRNDKKDSYKNRYFDPNRKSAVDEYTGERVFRTTNHTTAKTANTDHIVPIDQLKDKYKGKLTEDQLRQIANSDYNLAITNEKLNKAKKGMHNHQYLCKQLKEGTPENAVTTYNMLHKEVTSSISIKTEASFDIASNKISEISSVDTKYLKQGVQSTGKSLSSAVNSGASSALITLTVSSVNNIVSISTGEKTLEEGIKDIAKETGGSFVSAAGLDLTQQAVSAIVSKCGNSDIAKILAKDLPIAEISAVVMIGNSAIKYLNGEISGEECVTEILMNGAGVLAYSLGMSMGGPAGAVIASIVVGAISKTIIEYKQQNKLAIEKEKELNHMVGEALLEMEHQRSLLISMSEAEYKKNETAFNNGYELIILSALQNDVEGIGIGLTSILTVFNHSCRFKSREEFDVFFFDENAILNL